MRAGLGSSLRAAGVAGVCVVLAGIYLWYAARAFRAERAAAIIDQPHLERAMRLEPGNSEYPYRLGMYAFRIQQDATLAEHSFQRAITLNPYMTRYWLGLASAYVAEGEIEKQKSAIEAAIAAEPTNPGTTAEAANLYIVEDDIPRALRMFRVTLQSELYDEPSIFATCWRATHDADLLLKDALPDKPAVRLRFLKFLADRNEADAAAKVWNAVMSGAQPVSSHDAMPYVDYLLAHHDIAAAWHAWQQLVSDDQELKGYSEPGNRVVNNHFDQPLLDAGFDWRVVNNPAVTLNLDSLEFHDQGRSLKLAFTGDPFRDAGVSQIIPLEPARTYSFAAWVKTEEIYSASGPRFSIDDASTGKQLMLSNALVGTTPWQKLEGEFRTEAATQAVRLHVIQSDAAHIKGSMWLDGVAIAPK